jgi:hypothetical protein
MAPGFSKKEDEEVQSKNGAAGLARLPGRIVGATLARHGAG